MGQAPSGSETDGTTGSLGRYARWRVFDTTQQNGLLACCWVDRKTGRLVYQPVGLDPNLLAVPSAPLYSFAG